MAGKRCDGDPNSTPTCRESKAYCEGRHAATDGALKATNPHPAGTTDADLWDTGWDSYAAGAGTPLDLDCCAEPAYSGA